MTEALPFADRIIGVGLDSGEVGNPPEPYAEAYALARSHGLHAVAHAGEEGPASYIVGALDALHAERIEHGAAARHDPDLMKRLRDEAIPLTTCPLSSLKLRVYDRIEDAPMRLFHEAGLKVTINSDDPAYFGGYVLDNYVAIADGLDLDRAALTVMARNSLEATFLDEAPKAALLDEFDRYVASAG